MTETDLLAGLRSVERPNALVILVGRPGDRQLQATDGRRVVSDRLADALARQDAVVRIPRNESASLGLPPRTALAGLARVDGVPGGPWEIVAVASAERERDREVWARRRLVLSVLTAAGLVLVFGGLAMRKQRKELVLERELAIAGLQQSRDERLERASKAAAMGTLAMGVAHEISTPLGVIAARAEQMRPRVVSDERLSAGVNAILSQTDRINQVIRGLLGLARGEAPASERIDPRAVIENAVALVEHRFAKAGVGLRQEIDGELPAVVGDPRLLEHAVVNLAAQRVRRLPRRRRRARSAGAATTPRSRSSSRIRAPASRSATSGARWSRSSRPRRARAARAWAWPSRREIVANHRGRLVFTPGEPRGTRAAIRLPPVEALRMPSAAPLAHPGRRRQSGDGAHHRRRARRPRLRRRAARRRAPRRSRGSSSSSDRFDAIVTDLRMPKVDGLELLAASRRLDADRPVIVMTAYSAIDTAVESIRQGAYHYLTKPFKQDELAIFLGRALDDVRVRREAVALKTALRAQLSKSGIIGHSAAIQAVRERIRRVADAPAPVIVFGETGTGKGLVARALHVDSRRAERPFVAVNCAALPETLLESELFGYVKGAFTGAAGDRAGLFAEADGGTLFLDEIGEMTPALQAKLLHVLESGTVRAVGAVREREVDVRIIAATHQNLPQLVRDGRFREDLLYRLDVVSIVIPALRDRREDIRELLDHFFASVREKYPQSPVQRFGAEALRALERYRWPGNVRELAHTVEKLVLLGADAEIAVRDLPEAITGAARPEPLAFGGEILPLRELERRYAAWALAQTGGHRGKTAEKLGVDPKTLRKWLGDVDRDDDE